MSKRMIDVEEFLWGFSIISLALYFLQGLKKVISMASLSLNSPLSSPLPPPLSWVNQFFVGVQGGGGGSVNVSENLISENSKGPVFLYDDEGQKEENFAKGLHEKNSTHENYPCVLEDDHKVVQENIHREAHMKGLHDEFSRENSGNNMMKKRSLDSAVEIAKDGCGKEGVKSRKRPAKLLVPEYSSKVVEFGEMERKLKHEEFEVEGRDFCLASKKGRREVMEDVYGVMVDILGDPKQAFFSVIDGHGGRAAADYVAENLGKNIVKGLENLGEEEGDDKLEQAIRGGYLVTDKEFLSQGVSSGACAASVLVKDGELHVANVGDCRVVLSRKRVAHVLTNDHRVSREDERLRIENSGGFVHCRNGVWRVQGSLAVSRAIGDEHLKQWIISEPDIRRISLTSDCEFLIIASDGLWDKVNEQEAVDEVSRDKNSILQSCKKLVDISCSRGNMDDITVMVINLEKFVTNNGC